MQNVSAYLDFLGTDKLNADAKKSGLPCAVEAGRSQRHGAVSTTRHSADPVVDGSNDDGDQVHMSAGAKSSRESSSVEARVWFSVVPPAPPSRTEESASTDELPRTPIALKMCAHRFTSPDNDWGFRELLPISQAREHIDDTGMLILRARLVVHSKTFTAVRDRILAATARQPVDWIEVVRQVNLHGAIAATAVTKLGIAANNDQAYLIQAACKTGLGYGKLLVERGATLDVLDNSTRSPLFYAARAGLLDVVKWLVENNVELNLKDSEGRTALFYACEEGRTSTVSFLIAEGAEYAITDYDGDTPARLAESRGHDDIAGMLRALLS